MIECVQHSLFVTKFVLQETVRFYINDDKEKIMFKVQKWEVAVTNITQTFYAGRPLYDGAHSNPRQHFYGGC